MDENRESVIPKESGSSKGGFITPLPVGFDSLDDFEVDAVFSMVVFTNATGSDGGKEKREKIDKGDSCLVGSLGD